MSKQDNVLEIAPSTILLVLLAVVVIVLVGIRIFAPEDKEAGAGRSVLSEENVEREVKGQESQFVDPAIVEASVNVDLETIPYLGDLDSAKYAIVEFTDFQCPFCQRHSEETFPLISENYIEKNEVVYIFHDMPIYPPASTKLSIAGLCIFEDAGIDQLLNYRSIAYDINFQDDDSIFDAIEGLEVDQDFVRGCYEDEKYADDLDNHVTLGRNIGITGVPGFVVGEIVEDGTVVKGFLIPGAYPFGQFEEVLEFLKN